MSNTPAARVWPYPLPLPLEIRWRPTYGWL